MEDPERMSMAMEVPEEVSKKEERRPLWHENSDPTISQAELKLVNSNVYVHWQKEEH